MCIRDRPLLLARASTFLQLGSPVCCAGWLVSCIVVLSLSRATAQATSRGVEDFFNAMFPLAHGKRERLEKIMDQGTCQKLFVVCLPGTCRISCMFYSTVQEQGLWDAGAMGLSGQETDAANNICLAIYV